LTVVDRFQFVIDITNLLRYLCFDTNQSIPTSQSYLTKPGFLSPMLHFEIHQIRKR
jgi:hypothetical protein